VVNGAAAMNAGPRLANVEPLRVGILGAARINDLSIIEPAHAGGARLLAVAARDPRRAAQYAEEKGIERVHATYADLINDPDIEAVYNPLPNGLHASWNAAAIRAGKHVLTEKPFASNAVEAAEVHQLAQTTNLVVFEAFHYRYHPIFEALLQVITDGSIGDLQDFQVTMAMPAPEPTDLRWSWSLSGGCLMDLGCYCLHAVRTVAAAFDGMPQLQSVHVVERAGVPQIDEQAHLTFMLPNGAQATASANMAGDSKFTMTAIGSAGSAHIPNFIHVHEDDRLIITTPAGERVERLGQRSTYAYQLDAFTQAVREGAPYPTTSADAVANMQLIDDCYRAAGLSPRQALPLTTDR
jgi:predicted dehydrogenase